MSDDRQPMSPNPRPSWGSVDVRVSSDGKPSFRLRGCVNGKLVTAGTFPSRDDALRRAEAVYRELLRRGKVRVVKDGPKYAGGVYFIGCDVTGLVKIGYSDDPERRLRDLQVGSPTQLRVLAVVAGNMAIESKLHAVFADDRRHGEWFSLSDRIMGLIESVNDGNGDAMVARLIADIARGSVE